MKQNRISKNPKICYFQTLCKYRRRNWYHYPHIYTFIWYCSEWMTHNFSALQIHLTIWTLSSLFLSSLPTKLSKLSDKIKGENSIFFIFLNYRLILNHFVRHKTALSIQINHHNSFKSFDSFKILCIVFDEWVE